ncbi:MAG: hypothetical protein RBU29_11305 [bacterium]|nr:hypothetical protein [bacterium]
MQNHSSTHKLSPWTCAGSFIFRHPIITTLFCFCFFWLYRAHYPSGDGDQIVRFTETNIWMVQSELLSQAIFVLTYKILAPWGWDGFSAVNLVSCVMGALSVWVLLRFNQRYIQIDPLWVLGLFFSSCFFILCCGHTEYYTSFLFSLLLYLHVGVGYLKDRHSALQTALVFSFAGWIHMGVLFALPSLLLLPFIKGKKEDHRLLLLGLIPLVIAYYFKSNFGLFGLRVQGQSAAMNFVPIFTKTLEKHFYTMFEWGHGLDIIWAWTKRSWLFWPLVGAAVYTHGFQGKANPERRFLLIAALCLLFFALVWHPDLRVTQDWDLLSFEAAPTLLLLLTFFPAFLATPFRRWLTAIPTTASIAIVFAGISTQADFGERGYGRLTLLPADGVHLDHITVDGHQKPPRIKGIKQDTYSVKIIDRTQKLSYNFYAAVCPGTETIVKIHPKTPPPNAP